MGERSLGNGAASNSLDEVAEASSEERRQSSVLQDEREAMGRRILEGSTDDGEKKKKGRGRKTLLGLTRGQTLFFSNYSQPVREFIFNRSMVPLLS